jgi:hypothetical protein
LEAVLQSGLFSIARDICRFVRSIDPLDMLSPIAANTPAALKQHKPSAVLMRKGTIVDDAATQAFVYPPHFCTFTITMYIRFLTFEMCSANLSRHRLSSVGMVGPTSPVPSTTTSAHKTSITSMQQRSTTPPAVVTTTNVSPNSVSKQQQQHQQQQHVTPIGHKTSTTTPIAQHTSSLDKHIESEEYDMDDVNELHVHILMILTKHARYLLQTHRLRHLGVLLVCV